MPTLKKIINPAEIKQIEASKKEYTHFNPPIRIIRGLDMHKRSIFWY